MHYFGMGYSNSQWNFGTCGYQDHNGILFPFFYGVQENTDAEIQAVDSVCRIKSYISDQTGWSVTFSGVTDFFLCDNFADLCILWNYFYQILMALFTKMSHFGFYIPWIFPLFSFKPFKSNARETWCVILVSESWHILLRITAHLHFVPVGAKPLSPRQCAPPRSVYLSRRLYSHWERLVITHHLQKWESSRLR